MKKIILGVMLLATAAMLTGCGSCRTPASGKNSKLNYYNTFFGISIESLVYGDGLLVNGMSN